MTQRLFQDADGLIPAVLAGQPVGRILRAGGDQDALQAMAPNKPMLARWPKTGRRMLQNRNIFNAIPLGLQLSSNSVSGFGTSFGGDGINADVLDRGMDGGEPYIVIRFYGTNAVNATKFMNISNTDFYPIGATAVSLRAKVTLLAGSLGSSDTTPTLRAFTNFRRAGAGVNGGTVMLNPDATERTMTATINPIDGLPCDEVANRGIYLRVPPLAEVDAPLKIKALQIESGTEATPFQVITSPNDITQAGIADLWHLYNDGNDALNVTLPAGAYGLASIDINRVITVTSIISDGATQITTLRHERQLDVILRAGAFSTREETAIRSYWARAFL